MQTSFYSIMAQCNSNCNSSYKQGAKRNENFWQIECKLYLKKKLLMAIAFKQTASMYVQHHK